MKIRFVTEPENRSWILRPLCECLSAELPDSDISTQVDPSADFNVFFNYALYKSVGTKVAALFTHRETGQLGREFDRISGIVDWCFCSSYKTLGLLPPYRSSRLPTYPTREDYYRDIVIGVCGRRYSSGRKRFEWAEELDRLAGVEVWITDGKLVADEMPGFYRSIDYLLVTSSNEGGPQPVIEAVSMGVPVIAPNVGYCWEYPGYRYTTKQELFDLVDSLIIPRGGWSKSARQLLEDLSKC